MLENGAITGVLASLILEVGKWVFRLVTKNPTYDFPALVYTIGIPVLAALLVPLVALAGFPGYVMPTDWLGFVRNIILVLLSAVVGLGSYTVGIKPLKDYGRALKLEKEAKG